MDTVIVTGARAPIALHLARLLSAAGRRVVLADSFRWPFARAATRGGGYERLPSPTPDLAPYLAAWTRILDRDQPVLVIPTCEEVFHLAAARDLFGLAIPLFAPPLATLARAHDKHRFAMDAVGLGADPPTTTRLTSRADVIALGAAHDLVLKPVWSRFGSRTLVAPGRDALATLSPSQGDPWVAQALMPGAELCATAVAHAGVLKAVSVYRPLWRAGLGAAVAFEPVAEPVAAEFCRRFCARFAWTGAVSFDFKRDRDGALRALECNPRPTSGIHFFAPDDGLAAAILDGLDARASGTRPMTLPLAMNTYGLIQALREGRLAEWRRDRGIMDDLAAWPGERGLLGWQIVALLEIAGLAALKRKGLRDAATDDIDWNGGAFRCGGVTRSPA